MEKKEELLGLTLQSGYLCVGGGGVHACLMYGMHRCAMQSECYDL